jgi:cadmium resistance protein CadD (predicted permease)
MIAIHSETRAMFAVIAASLTTFAATNIGDLVLLAILFSKRVSMRRAIAGQSLGFAGIVAVSLTLLAGVLTIRQTWFRLIGILPVIIGIRHLLRRNGTGETLPANLSVLSIAGIIFSDGADNVGIYLPFFAANRAHLGIILALYALLLPVWCLAGKWLGERPFVLRSVSRYGHWIVPFVFIGVGLYILIG